MTKQQQVRQLLTHLDLKSDKNLEWFIMHIVAIWELAEGLKQDG